MRVKWRESASAVAARLLQGRASTKYRPMEVVRQGNDNDMVAEQELMPAEGGTLPQTEHPR